MNFELNLEELRKRFESEGITITESILKILKKGLPYNVYPSELFMDLATENGRIVIEAKSSRNDSNFAETNNFAVFLNGNRNNYLNVKSIKFPEFNIENKSFDWIKLEMEIDPHFTVYRPSDFGLKDSISPEI